MGYKLCIFCENCARHTPLHGVFIPHFNQIWVKTTKNFSFWGPTPLSLHRWGLNLARRRGPAKFHPHRCNVSPMWGEKPQNWPLSNLNTDSIALRAMLSVINPALQACSRMVYACNLVSFWSYDAILFLITLSLCVKETLKLKTLAMLTSCHTTFTHSLRQHGASRHLHTENFKFENNHRVHDVHVLQLDWGKIGYYVPPIIIQTFVTRTVWANILNLRRRQSLGEEDGGSEV